MPIFRYKGYNEGGKTKAGIIEADGIKDAASKIKTMGLYPREIEEFSASKKKGIVRSSDSGRLSLFTRQLSVLLASGVPLVSAIDTVSKESRGGWHSLLVQIKERVVSGASLSRTLDGQREIFPEFYISMVRAGEESGTLDKVLERLSDYLEAQDEMKGKIRTAMIYPIFMASVGIVVLSFLFIFVVPKIVRIFEDQQAALPLVTIILIGISNLFVNFWWLLILIAAGLLASGKPLIKRYRAVIDGYLFRLFHSLYLARLTRNLGFLLNGGLPMLRALELAGKTTGNLYIEGIIRGAALKVSEGANLSAAVSGLPPVLVQLVSTGEKSGRLPEVLSQAAGAYEAEFSRRMQKAVATLEPAMILLMGGVVGFIVFAILLPMFQLNQLIR